MNLMLLLTSLMLLSSSVLVKFGRGGWLASTAVFAAFSAEMVAIFSAISTIV